ncbi:hypothetical protein JOC37_000865 [Desulfohalotomaculum tongense]|uniref:hypothetical protein n=1 Tax=Desulforadius tongensis TaxID=1216062 RepID=UPI00195C8FC1|nr:hypothetical protein [Desulforadius tongensis]MBM7854492.1 hypothetical protein [Desulforadius tongensis]
MAADVRTRLGKWRQADAKYRLLFLMTALYPLLVVPGQWKLSFWGNYQWDYFYAPRYLVLAAVSLWALAVLFKERARFSHRAFIPLGVFLFCALVAVSLAAYPLTAWVGAPLRYTGLCTYLFCIILFILASCTADGTRLLPYMAASAAVVSFLAVLQACGFNPVPHEAFREGLTAYGTLGNPDYLGTYAAFVLPAALQIYLGRRRPVWLAAAAVIYAGLLVSFNWGAWLGAFWGLAVIVRYNFSSGSKKAWLAPAGALLAVTLVFAAGVVFWGLAGKVGVVSLREQAAVWENTLQLLSGCWAFGLGPDHLVHVVRMLPFAFLLDKTPSLYIETAVAMGAFALLAYLTFFGFVLREMGRQLPARCELLAMIVVYLVQGLFHFETILVMPLFWIVLGLVMAGADGALPGEAAAKEGALTTENARGGSKNGPAVSAGGRLYPAGSDYHSGRPGLFGRHGDAFHRPPGQ